MDSEGIKFDMAWVDECVESIYKEVVEELVSNLPKAKEMGENGVAYTNSFIDNKRKLNVIFGLSIEEVSDGQAPKETAESD